jgi:anti-sigma factor RsiW
MTQAERDELVDLSIDDALPEALRAATEAHLAAHLEAAADAVTLQAIVRRLKSAPSDRPDAWFAERALDRLLREHAEAQEAEQDTERLQMRRI